MIFTPDVLLEWIEKRARVFMTECLKHGHMFSPNVTAFRDNEQVAAVFCDARSTNDDILQIAMLASAGWGADILGLVFDSYFTEYVNNPTTGRPWESGEMGQVLEKHKGKERGWVTDAISIVIANRDGDWALATLPYSITGERVKWDEPIRAAVPSDGSPWGYMAGMIDEMMHLPPLDTTGLPGDPPPDESRVALDCLTARMITMLGGMVAMVAPRQKQQADAMERMMRNMDIHADIVPPMFTNN